MICLKNAQVFKYKSIEDSTPVEIAEDITVLVGKNESGKTAFLESLYKSLPLDGVKFNVVFDYPRKDYIRYRPQHEAENYAKVVELTFAIGTELATRINTDLFGGEKIISGEHRFTRSTNYNNGSFIGLDLPNEAALTAFKKSLGQLDHVDDVFASSNRLEQVLDRIQALDLPADATLGIFAKDWSDRAAKKVEGWDILGWYVWNHYISPSLPKFLYFDDYNLLDGKINLDSLEQRKASNTLTEADKTALGLFDLAGTDLAELTSEEGYENSKAKLEAISITITEQIFQFWRQNRELTVEFDVKADPRDVAPYNVGKNLYIRIKNIRHGVTVPFDQRSKGFIWFFSFMVWFSAIENRLKTDKNLILLLDEPGLNLHAMAQADFLTYIDELSKQRQIIYTTHSPFMVDSHRLHTVRVVEDRLKEGTKITSELEGSAEESLFPLQAALGYSIAQNLFIGKKNVLVEGPADLILLQHVSTLLQEAGGHGLVSDVILVPVGGLDKLATFVALLGANKLRIAVLHDWTGKPHQKLEDLIHHKLIEKKRILDFSMFRTTANQETDIEDLFPVDLYLDAFAAAYHKELGGGKGAPKAKDLPRHPRIVERLNQWLATSGIALLKDGGFNHYRVAKELLNHVTAKSLKDDDLKPFIALFDRLNGLLD